MDRKAALALVLFTQAFRPMPHDLPESPLIAAPIIPSGTADIPPFEIYCDSPGFSPGVKYARFAVSNVRDIAVDVTFTFYQEDGSIVYDGNGPTDAVSVQAGGRRGFTAEGQFLNYNEPASGAPSGTPSITFTLPAMRSCAIYMRAGQNFAAGPWPLGNLAAIHAGNGNHPGFRGFALLTWQAQQAAPPGPALLANGGIWSWGDWEEGPELVINGGMAF